MLSLGRNPIAVETMWHTGRKVHGRDGFQRLSVEQYQVAAIAGPVVDETHRHTVVLGGIQRRRNEDELAGLTAWSETDRLGASRGDIVLEDGVGPRDASRSGGIAHRIAVPVRAADQSLVDARELLRRLIEPLLDDLAGCEVDRPSLQRPGPGHDG